LPRLGAGVVLLTRSVLAAMNEEDGSSTVFRGLVIFAVAMIPVSMIGNIGLRMAGEKILMTASAKAEF
jgi:hypothetical protein